MQATWWELCAGGPCTHLSIGKQGEAPSLPIFWLIIAMCCSALSICPAPGPEQETPMSPIDFCFSTVRTGACIHGSVPSWGSWAAASTSGGLSPRCDLDRLLVSYCPALLMHSASVRSCFIPQRRNLPLVAFT